MISICLTAARAEPAVDAAARNAAKAMALAPSQRNVFTALSLKQTR
jgi:hypothetical protein